MRLQQPTEPLQSQSGEISGMVNRAPIDQRELATLTGNPTHARSSAKRGS